MASFKISTNILTENSVKTLHIAERMQDISLEISMVNRNLHGCFPEESISALRLSDFSASLETLAGRLRGIYRAMDDCAASYVNAEEQASDDLIRSSAGASNNRGRSSGNPWADLLSPVEENRYINLYVGGAGTVITASSFTQADIRASVLGNGHKKEVYISAGVQTVAMFAFSGGNVYRTVENMRDAHYARNEKNTDLPKTAADAEKQGWKKCDESLYHQFDSRSKKEIAEDMINGFPNGNQKYISDDGREVVYTPDGKQIVTDPQNMGTYNYVEVNNAEDIFGHLALDVIPYWLWGNSPDDSTPFVARVLGPLFNY